MVSMVLYVSALVTVVAGHIILLGLSVHPSVPLSHSHDFISQECLFTKCTFGHNSRVHKISKYLVG